MGMRNGHLGYGCRRTRYYKIITYQATYNVHYNINIHNATKNFSKMPSLSEKSMFLRIGCMAFALYPNSQQ